MVLGRPSDCVTYFVIVFVALFCYCFAAILSLCFDGFVIERAFAVNNDTRRKQAAQGNLGKRPRYAMNSLCYHGQRV